MKFHKALEVPFDSDDGSDFIPCPIKNGANKKANFENFLKDQYSTVAAKYTFLSSQQIKKRILDMWKKNPKLQENLDKTVKISNDNTAKGLTSKKTISQKDTKKQIRSSSKGKVLVPLNVDVFPTSVKGVLKSGEKDNCAKRHVSFNNEPEIRYRTASEASSNSTSKSNKKTRKNSKKNIVLHSNVQYRSYSSRILKLRKLRTSSMSDTEKNFDELLNDKCSWSYKTLKTIHLETNNSLPQIQNADAPENASEKEDNSFLKSAISNFNELENINNGTENEQNTMNDENEVMAEVSIRHDYMSDSSYNYTASDEKKVISCKNKNIRDANKNDASVKKSLRHVEHKSYAESDTESNAYSSSDEEVVLQTRICNEEGKPISNIPDENSKHTNEHMSTGNYNKFCNDNSDNCNFENGQNETFDSPSGQVVNTIIPVKDHNQNVNLHFSGYKDSTCLERSFSEKRNQKNKIAAETSSLELSSLSEVGDTNDEMFKDVCTSPSNEMKKYKKCTTDLHAEIVQRCLDISSEVHSMCDDIETPETSTLNEIVHDFFSGTLDVNKYEINKMSPKNATVCKEKYENGRNKKKKETKISNIDQESFVSIPHTQHPVIITTDSDDEQVMTNLIKPSESKDLKIKQNSKTDRSTIKKKTIAAVHLPKNCLNNIQKNNKLGAKTLKSYESFNRKIETKITDEDPLFDGSQDLEKSHVRNEKFDSNISFDSQNDQIIYSTDISIARDHIPKPAKGNALKCNATNVKLNYLKLGNHNPTTLKCIREAMVDKSSHTITMKQGNFQTDEISESCIMERDKLQDFTGCTSFQDNLFQLDEGELQEKVTGKGNRKERNQCVSKANRKARNVSPNNESNLFVDEPEELQQKSLTNNRHKNNSPLKTTRVKHISNEVSTNFKENNENRESNKILKNTKTSQVIEKVNMKKRPKTWEDLENLFSNEKSSDSDTLQVCQEKPTFLLKKAVTDENTSNALTVRERINKQNKKARIQADAANECSIISIPPQNKYSPKLRQNSENDPEPASKRNNELALISPNANIINKIMKNMERCTLPYLTSSQESQRTLLNDLEANNDCNKSPIVTEYSYSIKEIQSTILFTTGKTNSAEQLRNMVKSDNTKTRLCRIEQKSVSNKNYQVQKQETTLKTLSNSKYRFEDKSSVAMKLNEPRFAPKQSFNKKNETKGNASKENTKHNLLNNILARLEVDVDAPDSQKNNNFGVDNETNQRNRRNNINKKTPDLNTSLSTMESSHLSPRQVEQGHYNLRKRKSKNYVEEIDNTHSSKKKVDGYFQNDKVKSCSVANHREKRDMDWNDEETYNTDSSCEIVDIPKQKSNQIKICHNRKLLKEMELKKSNSKSKYSPSPLRKKKTTESGKKESMLLGRKFQEPLNSSDESNVDSEGSIYECNDIKICGLTNEAHTKVKPNMHWNKDNTFENSNSDSSCEIFDFPKQGSIQLKRNQNRKQSKMTKVANSKSDSSKYPNSNKKKIAGSDKTGSILPRNKCHALLNNNDASNEESENELVGKIDRSKNTLKKNGELLSKASSPNCSNKTPQMGLKNTTNKNLHLYSGKERFRHDFPREQKKLNPNLQIRSSAKQSLKKSHKEDSYKKYLETIFKNTKQKTVSHRNALSTIQEQKYRGKGLIEDSEENDELFSLSSSDSEDSEAPTRKTGLGLLDDTLCKSDDYGKKMT